MLTLSGLPLNDPDGRWKLNRDTNLKALPARISTGAALPGRDGSLPSLGSTFEPATFPIGLTIKGASRDAAESDLELLFGVIGQRHKLLPLVDTVRQREVGVEILSSVEPDSSSARFHRITLICRAPSVFWRDLVTVDATASITGSTATTVLTTLAGTTGTINDALIRFQGGFSSATVTDPVSGDQITVNAALADTEYLVVDTANWVARKHTTDSWSTTAGANAVTSVVSNQGSGPMLALNPDFATGAGRVRLQVKGVNVTGSPTVEVRAKRSFL